MSDIAEKKSVKRKSDGKNGKVKKKKLKIENEDEGEKMEIVFENLNKDEDRVETNDSDKDKNDAETEDEIDENCSEFPKVFNLNQFRVKLRGKDFINELRHFLHLAKKSNKIVIKYIDKKGKPLELVEAIERINKENLHHLSYICDALQEVLMQIIVIKQDHIKNAVNASKFFLKSYSQLIEKLLQSPSRTHQKIILKLLTAMVCLEPELGRQILDSCDSLINTSTISVLLSHSAKEIKETGGAESVRKTFIHFVLSYLVDGNIILIRNILDKRDLLKVLFNDLIYDDHVTVCVVLDTIRKSVIENIEVPKTQKYYLFDLDCVKNLFRLYDWLGPQMYGKQKTDEDIPLSSVEQENKELVRKSLHEMLIILLTSRKYGLAFDSMTHFKEKTNKLQKNLMVAIRYPWGDELKTDLIIKVLTACPDIAHTVVKHYGHSLNPSKTGMLHWEKVGKFIIKIINALHPSIFRKILDKITLTEYSNLIKAICLCPEILIHIKMFPIHFSSNHKIRFVALQILHAMFQQFVNYMIAILSREKYKGSELRRFKLDLINHVFVHFPTAENILLSAYEPLKGMDLTDTQNLSEFLEVLLDLILLFATHHRSYLTQCGSVVEYLQIMEPLFASEELGTKNVKLELKAIKTFWLLAPMKLNPNTELFEKVLNCFIQVLVSGEREMQKEAGRLLRGIFLNSHFFFESNLIEIDIWLETLRYFDAETVKLISFLICISFSVDQNEFKNEFEVIQQNLAEKRAIHNDNKSLDDLFAKIDSNQSVEGYIEMITLSKFLAYVSAKVEEDDEINKYLQLVSLLLFHYMPNPESVYEIYSYNYTLYKNYMKNCIKKNKVEMMQNVEIPFYNKIHKAIIEGEQIFFDIFAVTNNEESVQLKINDGKNEFVIDQRLDNERLISMYIFLIIYIIQCLVKSDRFDDNQSKASQQFLINFFKILHILDNRGSSKFVGAIFGETNTLSSIDFPYLNEILKYVYCNHNQILQLFNLFDKNLMKSSNENYLKFLCTLTDSIFELISEQVHSFLINFQEKIVRQIKNEVTNTKLTNEIPHGTTVVIRVLESFRLTSQQCNEILQSLCQLNYQHFVDQTLPQNKSIYYDILNFILNRSATIEQSLLDIETCQNLFKIYINLIETNETNEINLEKIEDSLYNFLLISHQCIEQIQDNVFEKIFDHKKITKSTIKLAILLMERNPKFQSIFLSSIEENLSKKELIYPLLKVLITQNIKFEFRDTILKEIYKEFKNGFMKTIEKPIKAGVIYKENVEVSIYLVNKLMPINECIDISKKTIKTDAVKIFQLKLLNTIYHKAIVSSLEKNSDDSKIIFVNFIVNVTQLYNIVIKHDPYDETTINYLNYMIFIWVQSYFNGKSNNLIKKLDFENFKTSQHWSHFSRSCLKIGLHEAPEDSNADRIQGNYIKILALLSHLIYNCSDSDLAETSQLFESIITNPKFTDIAYGNKQSLAVKTEIFNLLLILVQKNQKVLDKKHIPIFLAAYHAKLSPCDRFILGLIQFYEEHGINLYEFRPFVWGDSAVIHYSLQKTETATLKQKEPSTEQVMNLIDPYICDFTIQNFPVWRKLNALKQLPDQNFVNPDNLVANFGANAIESHIEYEKFYGEKFTSIGWENQNEVNSTLLKLCLKRKIIYENCYDPAFIIPLMSMCFSAEVYTHPVRPVQNGLLGIVFAAMSSQDKPMRLAAGCCQLRYREHIEGKKFFDQSLWLQAYDNIQNGLNQLQNDWTKHKKKGIPRVPFIPALFLAKAVNLLTLPTDPLYKTIVMYLRLKESFNFLCIPEFNVLFHNSNYNHVKFQRFILDVINNGIKSSSDVLLLISNNIFKAIMGFYFSVMTTLELQLQILSIISTCCKIPASSKLLVEYVGVLSWLNGVIEQLDYYKFDTIEAVISIISNLWFSIKIRQKDFFNINYIEMTIFKLCTKVCPHISSKISVKNFARFLNILQKTAHDKEQILKEELLDRLFLCAQKHFEKNCYKIINIRKNGVSGVESKQLFLKNLIETNVGEDEQLALLSLREFVIKWTINKKSKN